MTLDEAIKHAENVAKNYDCKCGQDHQQLAEWLKELKRYQWIPVSERLPEKSKQVMCCDKQGRVFTSSMTYINSNGEPSFGKHYSVIAWMPLPPPYEGGETV